MTFRQNPDNVTNMNSMPDRSRPGVRQIRKAPGLAGGARRCFQRCLSTMLLLTLPVGSSAGEPASYFVTHDEACYIVVDGKQVLDPKVVEAAKMAKECRPAELDREGNWGFPYAGAQLGLRFTKTVFTNGEPIIVAFYLRNTGDESISYLYPGRASMPFGILITKDNEKSAMLSRGDEHSLKNFGRVIRIFNGSKIPHIPVGMQDRRVFGLHTLYDLSRPGKYFVSGSVELVNDSRGESKGSINSGTAMIEVITNVLQSEMFTSTAWSCGLQERPC